MLAHDCFGEERTIDVARFWEVAATLPAWRKYVPLEVLSLRYTSEGGIARTYQEVGTALGVTRDRARQLTVKALREMRHPRRVSLWAPR